MQSVRTGLATPRRSLPLPLFAVSHFALSHFALSLFALLLSGTTPARGADPQSYDDLDHPMMSDPDLTIPPPVKAFDEALAKLWTDALAGPEADIRRRAAETIMIARRMGMEGLEIAIPKLVELSNNQSEHLLVRFAAMRALVALNAQQEAETVFRTAILLGNDAESEALAKLAEWRHEPARTLWHQRLVNPDVSHRELLLAIHGLVLMEDTQQGEQFKRWVRDQYTAFDIRLASARGLATLERTGLESLSENLLSEPAPTRRDRVLAANLLRYHSGATAEELLEKLALDPEPSVAAAALERLIEIAPNRIANHQAQLLGSRDAAVRRWTVQALAIFPSAENTTVLARVTNDAHPGVRVLARNSLLAFANDHQLRDAVLQEAEKLIVEKDWRGIEQACRLVGYLDHKPAARLLVNVLPNPRMEAHSTAAWAIRKLAVPETLPDVLQFATTMTSQAMRELQSAPQRDYDPLFTHLFQFFGIMKYQPADPLLRKYIPKMSMSAGSRSAAVWALGHIHQENPPADLIAALEERLLDVGTIPPESEIVRQYCAVSLGRMKAKETLPSLQHFYEEKGSYTGPSYACGWAIEQINGTPVDKPVAAIEYVQGWFLTPLQ